MLSTSLAQLPGNRNDLLTVGRKLQLAVSALDKISGNAAVVETAKLSRLEGEQEAELATLPDIIAELQRLRLVISDLTQDVAIVNEALVVIDNAIAELAQFNTFSGLANNDFDDASWGTFAGLAYASVLGADLSNFPSLVTPNAVATYQVFVSVRSAGAFSQSLQLIGDGNNRYFVRSGSDFTNAITNDWIEL